MKLQAERNIVLIPSSVNSFLELVSYETIKKRVQLLYRQLSKNELLKEYLSRKYWLEIELYQLLEYRRKYGVFPNKIDSEKQYEVYSFVVMVAQIYEGLTQTGKKRLKGMLIDGFKDDKGILPLKHEIDVVVHYVKSGFDIDFSDMENGGGFDFRVTKDTVVAEVECKCFSDDAGRKIHGKELVEFCYLLKPIFENAVEANNGGFMLNVTVGSRLPTESTVIAEMVNSLNEFISHDSIGVREFSDYKIEKKVFNLEKSPFNRDLPRDHESTDLIHEFCAKEFDKDNEYVFAYWRKKCAYVVIIDSEKEDNLIKRIYDDSKHACENQFSKKAPGIIVVRLTGISTKDIKEIAGTDNTDGAPSGFQQIATKLMTSSKRAHLHTIVFMPGRFPVKKTATNSLTSWSTSDGSVYFFRNNSHPEYDNPVLKLSQ